MKTIEGYQKSIDQVTELINLSFKQQQNYHKLKLSLLREMHGLEDKFWLDGLKLVDLNKAYLDYKTLFANAFGRSMDLDRYAWVDSQRLSWKKRKEEMKNAK